MRVIARTEHSHVVVLCRQVKYMLTLEHSHHIFFFFINIDFRVRSNALQRGDDFLFNGSSRGNFIKIPLANPDRGKNPSLFLVSLFQGNFP